jgi:hypothetical protein
MPVQKQNGAPFCPSIAAKLELGNAGRLQRDSDYRRFDYFELELKQRETPNLKALDLPPSNR